MKNLTVARDPVSIDPTAVSRPRGRSTRGPRVTTTHVTAPRALRNVHLASSLHKRRYVDTTGLPLYFSQAGKTTKVIGQSSVINTRSDIIIVYFLFQNLDIWIMQVTVISTDEDSNLLTSASLYLFF